MEYCESQKKAICNNYHKAPGPYKVARFIHNKMFVNTLVANRFLKGLDITWLTFCRFNNGDNFCDFLVNFLHAEHLLKRGLL